ncbi:MAG: ADP-ribosylation factor-like protein [Candidatus Hodarchaeales archaeon]|jgi:GTPase SAR1 family protein
MTLLSVKVFDENNSELISTVTISSNQQFYSLIPVIGKLAREETQKGHTQGLIISNQLIAFRTTIQDLMLVSVASINTSFQRLELFLNLLNEYLSKDIPNSESFVSSKHFQDLCNSIVKAVDSSNTELKISLLGLDRSGKSTFVSYLREDRPLAGFESYQPTQLLDIIKIDSIGNLPQIQFFDLGYAFQQQWWRFSNESDGYIFFVDSSDSKRSRKSQELFQEIRSFWDQPFVIAANMRDISRITNIRKYLARRFRISSRKIYETNTWTGDGISALLEGLVKNELQGTKLAVSVVHPNRKKK